MAINPKELLQDGRDVLTDVTNRVLSVVANCPDKTARNRLTEKWADWAIDFLGEMTTLKSGITPEDDRREMVATMIAEVDRLAEIFHQLRFAANADKN
jgi:hypothetical protein